MQTNSHAYVTRGVAALWLAASVTLLPLSAALAQPPAPPPAPSEAPVDEAAPPEAPADEPAAQPPEALPPSGAEPALSGAPHAEQQAATPPPPPTPAAPPTTPVASSVPVRVYGILWAGVFGTEGVQSFGYPTAVAPTAALHPALGDPNDPLLSFQVQQTRLGLVVGEGTPFKGTLEIDFAHFDQSSPTTQAFPRVRIATLEWKPSANHRLFLGQTWDIFGNATGPQLLSHSFNLVGTLFQAGNIGFMRHQLGWMGTFGPVEIAVAAGLQGANAGPTFNNIERSATPTGSARAMVHLGDHGVIGVSGVGSALELSSATGDERRMALGGELFGDLTFGGLNVHAELYLAQNLANMGALNLGQGRFGVDVADVGGYLSAKYTRGDHAITAMGGAAYVLNPSDVVPGYTPAVVGPPAVAAAPTIGAGPGMESNVSAHVGYWYSPVRGLSIVLEPYVYRTRFVLDPADVGVLSATSVAWGGTLGSMFQF